MRTRKAPDCPACDGPAMFLGALGWALWFRCRNCGWQWSRKGRQAAKRRQDTQNTIHGGER